MSVDDTPSELSQRPTEVIVLKPSGQFSAHKSLLMKGTSITKDLEILGDFIFEHRPTVIVIGANGSSAKEMHGHLLHICNTILAKEIDFRAPHLTFMDTEVADVWSTKSAKKEYETLGISKVYNPNIAKAISLARRLADPMTEIARLYNSEKDVLSLSLHPLQDMISDDLLFDRLGRACVMVVNTVGVDFNEMLRCPWKRHLLSFVSGNITGRFQLIFQVWVPVRLLA